MPTKKTKPQISLQAGAKTFELACDINAFCDLEAEFDLGVNQIISKFQDVALLRLTEVRSYLRVVLRSDGKALEAAHAHDVMEIAGIDECTAAVTRHIMGMFGRAEA